MNCDEANRVLVELVFGDLDSDAGIALNLHLAECANCRVQERRWLELRESARGESASPSRALRERIRASLPARRAHGIGASLGRPVPAYVAIAAALVGALVMLAGTRVRVPEAPRLMPPASIEQPGVAPGAAGNFFTTASSYATRVGSSPDAFPALDVSGEVRRAAKDSS